MAADRWSAPFAYLLQSWAGDVHRELGRDCDPQILKHLTSFNQVAGGENKALVKWLGDLPKVMGSQDIPPKTRESIQHALAHRPAPGDGDAEMNTARARVMTQAGMYLAGRGGDAGSALSNAAERYTARADSRAEAAARHGANVSSALARGPESAVAWAEKAASFSRQDWGGARYGASSTIEKLLAKEPPADASQSAVAARGTLASVNSFFRGPDAIDRGTAGAAQRFHEALAREGGGTVASPAKLAPQQQKIGR